MKKLLTAAGLAGALGLGCVGVAMADGGGGSQNRTSSPATPAPTSATASTPSASQDGSLAERRQLAQEALARAAHDTGLVVCLKPDGTLAGEIALDRVNPEIPLTHEQKQASCADAFPGSHA